MQGVDPHQIARAAFEVAAGGRENVTIYDRAQRGESLRSIARDFGVSHQAIAQRVQTVTRTVSRIRDAASD